MSVAVGLLGFFALGIGGDRLQVIVGWLALLATDVGLFVLARRVTRMPETPAVARRFWRATAVAAGVFAFGDGFQLGQILLHPAADGMIPGLVQSVGTLLG